MSKFAKAIAAIMLTVAVVCAAGCTKEGNKNVKVTTNAPKDITQTSAIVGGEVEVMADGISITEKGVCWGTSKNPTVSDNHMSDMGRNVTVTCTITGLEPGTKYHVRVYASDGTEFWYGSNQSFTTYEIGGGGNGTNANNGKLSGKFTINGSGNQIRFSQGNLQYQASTNTWRFAEHQWDIVGTQHPGSGDAGGTVSGSDNENISMGYNGWVDLFSWGTSGHDHGAVCYQPWHTSTMNDDYLVYGYYYSYGKHFYSLYDRTGEADWGCNPISNGGNAAGLWRTLNSYEWYYVFRGRETSSGYTWVKGSVNGVNGIILLPDDWEKSIYPFYYGLKGEGVCRSNNVTASDWTNILEPNGVVFLPAAGIRSGTSVGGVGSSGNYWSSSHWEEDAEEHGAYRLSFSATGPIYTITEKDDRDAGCSVRLVCPAE